MDSGLSPLQPPNLICRTTRFVGSGICRPDLAPYAVTIPERTASSATIALRCRMATLIRLAKSRLTIYAGDHNPPHSHVLVNDSFEALIDFASLRVIDGTVRPAVLKEALARGQPECGCAGPSLPGLSG